MFECFSSQCISLIAQAKPEPLWYQSGWFMFLLLVAVVVLGWFLAQTITKSLRLSEYSGRMTIVLVTLFIASLMIWSKWPPKFGVDLRGGINMVGSLNMEAFVSDDDPNAKPPEASDIIPALVRRVNPSGTKEIMIRALGKGQNRSHDSIGQFARSRRNLGPPGKGWKARVSNCCRRIFPPCRAGNRPRNGGQRKS